MTNAQLERGQELLKLIDECDKFVKAIEHIESKKGAEGHIVVNSTSSIESASIPIHRYKKVAAALKNEMKEQLNNYKQQFEAL